MAVDSKLVQWLGQWWCRLWGGHHNLGVFERNVWYLQCTHCTYRTEGIPFDRPAPPSFTRAELDDLYNHQLSCELDVHGGG
jgi:hypothetical protein